MVLLWLELVQLFGQLEGSLNLSVCVFLHINWRAPLPFSSFLTDVKYEERKWKLLSSEAAEMETSWPQWMAPMAPMAQLAAFQWSRCREHSGPRALHPSENIVLAMNGNPRLSAPHK